MDPERPLSGLLAPPPVPSPSRITLENNAKIPPQPDPENGFVRASGGDEGIRTLEAISRLHTFQARAFDHSATSPSACLFAKRGAMQEGFVNELSICAQGVEELRPVHVVFIHSVFGHVTLR